MNKGVIYFFISITFYLRLITICYVIKITDIVNLPIYRTVLLKSILMATYTYCYIFYIVLTKNIFQLKLYKIFLLINMIDIYFLFTCLNINYYIIFVYQFLLILDIFIEMYCVQTFYMEFMKLYVKKAGVNFFTYKAYIAKQKAKFCIIIYMMHLLLEMFFDRSMVDFSKLVLIFILYLSFFKNNLKSNFIRLTIVTKMLHILSNMYILLTNTRFHNTNVLYRAVFGDQQKLSCYCKIITSTINSSLIEGLNNLYEMMLLCFLIYYCIKSK